ncbi:MAG: hypothetical protein ABL982_26815, partial [Vicinamibacterales bacterium]
LKTSVTAAPVTLNIGSSGLYSVDGITSTQTAVFTGDGAKNVGSGKPIAVSDIVAGGGGIGNYTILNTTATASGRQSPCPRRTQRLTPVITQSSRSRTIPPSLRENIYSVRTK